MKKFIQLFFLGWFILTLSLNGFSQDDEFFWDIEVTSATKSSVTIQRAPSVIRAFTQEDFKEMGFNTLQDVLNNIPGLQVQQYRAGHQLAWIRGVQMRYNNKVLLLIDGVPMRDNYYGHFDINEMLPLDAVEKVEVINGPGSVLYGANSFSGVISITTKSSGRSVKAQVGSNTSLWGNAEFDVDNFYVNANYYQTDGFQPDYNVDGYSRPHNQKANNFYSFMKYKNESIMLMGSFTDFNYPYTYRSSKKEYYFHRRPMYGAASYTLDLEDKGSVKALGYYNYYGFNKEKIKFYNETTDTIKEEAVEYMNSAIFGVDLDYSINVDKHSFIVGVSAQQDRALDIHEIITFDEGEEVDIREENMTKSDVIRNNIGIFVQDVWSITDNVLFTAGLRYDILSDFEDQFNYRVGVTGQSNSNVYGKLLYGTSYRVPSYREYLDAASFNSSLQPEHLNTLEAQIGYLFDKGDINVTFFYNIYNDFIQEIVVDSVQENADTFREVDDEMAFNFNKRNISGVEFYSAFRPNSSIYLNLGASYLFNAREDMGIVPDNIYWEYRGVEQGETDIIFLSDYTINFLASYKIIKNFTVGVNGFVFGDRKVPENYQNDVPDDVQNADNAKGFFKLDAFASVNIAEKLGLYLKVNNITNEEIYSPPYGGSDGYDIEWPGTNVRFGIRYQFSKSN